MSRFTDCLAVVLDHEGGFVNHPTDPGGATNLGVTRRVWQDWIKKPVSVADMRKLTVADVAPLYERNYWLAAGCDRLPAGLDLHVFDFAVNAGPGRAVKHLQRILKVAQDGIVGPGTLSRIKARPLEGLIEEYGLARKSYYRALPHFHTFGRGWLRRTDEVTEAALKAARKA